MEDGGGGGGKWFAVGGRAAKEVAMREKRNRRREEREAAEAEARGIVGGDAAFVASRGAAAATAAASAEGSAAVRDARLRAAAKQHDGGASADGHGASAVLTVSEARRAEQERQRAEQQQQRARREADAEAARRRQAAQERAARARDPATWPTLADALVDAARGGALAARLDALHSDDVCRLSSQMRMQYALSVVAEALNAGNVREPDTAPQPGAADPSPSVSTALLVARLEASQQCRSGDVLEALDALFAHGRTATSLYEMLSAFASAKLFSLATAHSAAASSSSSATPALPTMSTALRFAAEGVLRGGAYLALPDLESALAFFTPALLDRSASAAARAAAAANLRFVWAAVIDGIDDAANLKVASRDSDHDFDDADDASFANADATAAKRRAADEAEAAAALGAFVARLAVGVTRVLNCAAKELRTTDGSIWGQIEWLVGAVARKLRQIRGLRGAAGPAVHFDSKPVLLAPDAVVVLIARLAGGECDAGALTGDALRDVLLLCGPRQHAQFLTMVLPGIVKRATPAHNAAVAARDAATQAWLVTLVGSLIAASGDPANHVAQTAPAAERYAPIATSPLLAAALAACAAAPVDRDVARGIAAGVSEYLASPKAATESAEARATASRSLASLQRVRAVAPPAAGTSAARDAPAVYRAPLSAEARAAFAADDADRASCGTCSALLAALAVAVGVIGVVLVAPDAVAGRVQLAQNSIAALLRSVSA
jgi:hypothetical protein